MTYVGQQPATTFDAGIQDRFTGLTTNTVTLNHEISAEEDILVVWNNIVQDKNTYSVGGTGNKTVTLGGTLVSADVVTVYYLNKVMQSVNPTAGSVTSTTITDDIISGQTALGTTPADTDEFIVSDAGTLKRVDYSHIKGVADGGVTMAKLSTSGTEADNVKQRVCKVWINLNGASSGAPARDDFNVSSTTDEGTGDYTINYSTDLANDDYAILTGSGRTESGSGGHNRLHEVCVDRYAVGSHRLLCVDSDDDSAKDMHGVFSAVFGDS